MLVRKNTATRSTIERWYSVSIACLLLGLALAITVPVLMKAGSRMSADPVASAPDEALPAPGLVPWRSVGGCGAGGGGGGAGGGAKWVGMGATGGLFDIEVMYSATVGQNYSFKNVSTRISGKPHWKWTLGVSLPWNSKDGEVQYQTNEPPVYAITGGIGDITADAAMTFGATGQFTASLGLTLPTGQYDITRGSDRNRFLLPTNLQNGGGIYNAALTLSYSRDVEDGIWLIDVGGSWPFAMRLLTGENAYIDQFDNIDVERAEAEENHRFYYTFKPYGENDLGDRTPPSLNASVFFGYRGTEHYVHSWGATFTAQLGVAYLHGRRPDVYNPTPDPDHQMWSGSLNYGLEFSRHKYPIFISIVKPIHDQSNGDTKEYWLWDGPDWKDFVHSWSVAIGVKSTMF